MSATDTEPRSDSKQAWKQRSDRGPHTAAFPSGATLTFTIPDSGSLLRSGRLPDRLRRVALMCAGHPEGAEGYVGDLVLRAMVAADGEERMAQALEDALVLQAHLVAEMLVEPAVTADEVTEGAFPELDVKMLLEFAERRRNVDAAGTRLPVIVLSEWASFRGEPESAAGAGGVGDGGQEHGGDVPDAD